MEFGSIAQECLAGLNLCRDTTEALHNERNARYAEWLLSTDPAIRFYIHIAHWNYHTGLYSHACLMFEVFKFYCFYSYIRVSQKPATVILEQHFYLGSNTKLSWAKFKHWRSEIFPLRSSFQSNFPRFSNVIGPPGMWPICRFSVQSLHFNGFFLKCPLSNLAICCDHLHFNPVIISITCLLPSTAVWVFVC